jgi:homocysteine S-methyltransferase
VDNANPLAPFLDKPGTLIVDGGFATELERRGHDLNDDLWSARLLLDDPEAISQVHYDYLAAGADCIISASYQGTIEGFMNRGLSHEEAAALLARSVEIAVMTRDRFWARSANREGRTKPIVAASVGPYGAYLADGSEFRGDYDLDQKGLREFHQERWEILAASGADMMACETIPSLVEARVLGELFKETCQRFGWVSFSCKDGKHINDGTPIIEAVEILDPIENVCAVGVNCTAPMFISSLIVEARRATNKPIVIYPNSGETYDTVHRRWGGESDIDDYTEACSRWRAAGASLIGGCCRTGPEHIRQTRLRLIG